MLSSQRARHPTEQWALAWRRDLASTHSHADCAHNLKPAPNAIQRSTLKIMQQRLQGANTRPPQLRNQQSGRPTGALRRQQLPAAPLHAEPLTNQ